MQIKINRLAIYLGGFIIILSPFFIYQVHIKWLGFPDGHLTDLDQFQKNIFPIFSGISISFGVFYLYFGWKISSTNKKIILIFSAIYFLFLAALVLIHYNIGSMFNNGTGG